MIKQVTLRRPASVNGKGLHTGCVSKVTFIPAAANAGIIIKNKGEAYALSAELVSGVRRGTCLKKGRSRVSTVEHMLSAVKAMSIDNVIIEIEGSEPPALDGSAAGFAEALKKAGRTELSAQKRSFTPAGPVLVEEKGAYIAAFPYKGFKVCYYSDFSGKGIGPQEFEAKVTPENYIKNVAKARTFGFKNELWWLVASGLIKGADNNNAILIDKGRPANTKLRFRDELTRHKVLDIIGDLAFIPGELNMLVIAYKTGHRHNIQLVKKLLNGK